ncbi:MULTISPECIES: hypothetical protein [Streptomyces violaceusniger group]|uniref:Uncharacterized protein n=2 Tax=Streptomyces rhizosphaericus TaxID=114699 RepID=A0ABN1S7G5_9ACTN|nr:MULTISPECIES: hypothetical protein [Streptomyces violaceusniger group]
MSEKRHLVTDAHGRSLDLMSVGQVPAVPAEGGTRRHRRLSAVGITGALVGGAVGIVLIIAIRDIAMTLAGTGIGGVILKALLAPSSRQER